MVSRVKLAVGRAFQKAGYTVVPNWRVDSLEMASLLERIFALYKIDCVFDIGANLGQFGQFLRQQVNYPGLIVSAEPVAATFAALQRTVAGDPDWLTYQVALGATSGRASITVTKLSELTSFLAPKGDIEVDHVEEVAVWTLPELVAKVRADLKGRVALANPYLKLDTQGHDLAVLRGAEPMLPGVRALQSEVSCVPIYEGMQDWLTAAAEMQRLGFAPAGLYPVTRDERLRVVEFDCVMINPA